MNFNIVSARNVSTTTTTTPEPTTTTTIATTTYSLPDVSRRDIRYHLNADHYWTATNLSRNGLPRDVNEIIEDHGSNNTVIIRALKSFGKSAYFSPLIIESINIHQVKLLSDSVTGAAFKFTENLSSCMKISDLRLLPNNLHQKCLRDPGECYYGFAVGVWVKFSADALKSQSKTILMASGTGAGFMLSQHGLSTVVEIRSGWLIWRATAYSHYVTADYWVIIGFSWSKSNGAMVHFI